MLKIKRYPALLLAIMGSMDCVTTVIGILYFGAVEVNPFIASVISTNLPAFVILKLGTTAFVCLLFLQTEKIVKKAKKQNAASYFLIQKILKGAYTGVILFLSVVVANNLLVLVNSARI
jgi:hypothetical protein